MGAGCPRELLFLALLLYSTRRVEKAGALLLLEQRVLPKALELEMRFRKRETGF